MLQEPKAGSLLDRIRKKLGIDTRVPKKRNAKDLKIGSGLANNAKLAIQNRRKSIDEQSGF